MRAKVIHATIDPKRLPEAAAAVRLELGPQFLTHPGARHGYWMADRATGHLLAITFWDSDELLRAASPAEAVERASVSERIGLRVLSVHTLEVLGAHEESMAGEPHLRWVRATWVDGLAPGMHGHLPQLYREAVPDQARSHGFCASYWLADLATGSGLGLSMWEGPAELSASELNSRHRRRRFEDLMACSVHTVAEYQALGVAQGGRRPVPADLGERTLALVGGPGSEPDRRSGPDADRTENGSDRPHSVSASGAFVRWARGNGTPPSVEAEHDPEDAEVDDTRSRTTDLVRDLSRRANLGTTIGCPPGALLAVRGDRSYQVVYLLDGRAAIVDDDHLLPMARGSHFGAHAVAQTRANARTVLATSPVQVHVFSRAEFAAVTDSLPSVAEELIAHDLDR